MMKKLIGAIAALLLLSGAALAQSSPNLITGQIPTAAQWNSYFQKKQDNLNFVPLNVAGGVLTGKLTVAPSTSSLAGFNVPQGTAPASPVNGDVWTTAAGMFVRVNGVTIGPLSSPAASFFTATSPLTVTFPGGQTNYACSTCGVTTNPLSQFATTTSAQLAGMISNETGTGSLVFASAPILRDPVVNGVSGTSSTTTVTSGTASAILQAQSSANVAIVGSSSTSPVIFVTGGTNRGSISGSGSDWTFGVPGTSSGTLSLAGSTSGQVTLSAGPVASGTWTFPSYTDTVVGNGTPATFTNKIIDTASIGNGIYINGQILNGNSGSGAMLRTVSPSINSPTITTAFTATGLVKNTDLVSPTVTVNGTFCTLGSTCAPASPASSVTVGSTAVTGGTANGVLYTSAGAIANSTTLPASLTYPSPIFTGAAVSVTPGVDTNTTQIPTTAWYFGQKGTATPLVDGTGAAGTSARWAPIDHVHPTDTTRAPLASPNFSGLPSAPTAPTGTNTIQLATTQFVLSQISASTSGVSNIDSRTGAFSTGNGIESTSGNVLQLTAARRKLPTTQIFLTGSGTYTAPADCLYIVIEMVGAGSGGGGSGTGGGGAAGTAGTTSFATLTAGGGNGTSGGIATNGNIVNLSGSAGGSAMAIASGQNFTGALGGGTPFGSSTPGQAGGANTGIGGSGGSYNAVSGGLTGQGGGSGAYIRSQLNAPSSHTYSVGAGSAGGAAGTSGAAGMAGGSGQIIVREYYN